MQVLTEFKICIWKRGFVNWNTKVTLLQGRHPAPNLHIEDHQLWQELGLRLWPEDQSAVHSGRAWSLQDQSRCFMLLARLSSLWLLPLSQSEIQAEESQFWHSRGGLAWVADGAWCAYRARPPVGVLDVAGALGASDWFKGGSGRCL